MAIGIVRHPVLGGGLGGGVSAVTLRAGQRPRGQIGGRLFAFYMLHAPVTRLLRILHFLAHKRYPFAGTHGLPFHSAVKLSV